MPRRGASWPPSSRRSTRTLSTVSPRWASDGKISQACAARGWHVPRRIPDWPDSACKRAVPVHPFLRLSGASKRFGGVVALDSVDWEVMPGEVHCLVGENGSGKSTLIKLVSGVHWPDLGTEIEVDGKPHAGITRALTKALGIHVIYQDLSLFPNLSAAENIAIEQVIDSPTRPVRRQRMRRIPADALARL